MCANILHKANMAVLHMDGASLNASWNVGLNRTENEIAGHHKEGEVKKKILQSSF